jgi:hypothetical protein
MSNRKMNSASPSDENRSFLTNQVDDKGKVVNQPVALQMDEEEENEDDELTEEDFAIDEMDEDSEDDQ